MVLWPGFCVVHEQFTARLMLAMLQDHPDAELIAHTECEQAVLYLAHFVGSTAKMIRHVKESPKTKFIVATEMGILHQMRKVRPDAEFIGAPADSGCQCAVCPYMRLNTMEKLYLCLRDLEPEVTVEEELRKRALLPVERMLALS